MVRRKQAPGPVRILIVEDDSVCQLFCEQVLAAEGREIIAAPSAAAAIELASSTHPALILLDLHLGHEKGETVLEAIRNSWPPLTPAPVFVAMTGESPRSSQNQHSLEGFQHVLRKPFTVQELRDQVECIFLHEGPRRRVNAGYSAATAQRLESALREDWDSGLDELDQRIAALDWNGAHATLHRLQGAAAFAGRPELAEGAGRLTSAISETPGSGEMARAYLELLWASSAFTRSC